MSDTADKFPELRAMFAALQEKRIAVLAKTILLRQERDQLLVSIQPTLDKVKALEQQYRKIEQESKLAEIDNQIGALAKAMGGRSMSGK